MSRLGMFALVGAVALAGCSKKDDKKEPAKAGSASDPKKVEHGKAEGKGTGGGEKTATGSKDGKEHSGKAPADPKVIERGKYVANLGGCAACHTPMGPTGPDMSKLFGGGLEMEEKLPDGSTFKWRTPNITNHDTGIGKWSDDQVIAAIREGALPDGRKVGPPMAVAFYNRITDDDAKALVAYLRSVPPVDNKVEPIDNTKMAEMMGPIPKAKNEPVPDDPVGKGAYVASIMHCAMCHTPMTDKGPDMSRPFAGGMPFEMPPMFGTGVLYAANITPDPETGIGKYSSAERVARMAS